MYGLITITPATGEPVSLVEAKRQCRVAMDDTAHDAFLTSLIVAARQHVESRTGRQLLTTVYEQKRDAFPVGPWPAQRQLASITEIWLPKPPISAVTWIKYVDQTGTLTTWPTTSYRVSTHTTPGRIKPAYATPWPVVQVVSDAITIRFTAGYGAAADVPAGIKAAILLLVASWFENREAVVIGTIQSQLEFAVSALLQQYSTGEEFTSYDRPYVSQ